MFKGLIHRPLGLISWYPKVHGTCLLLGPLHAKRAYASTAWVNLLVSKGLWNFLVVRVITCLKGLFIEGLGKFITEVHGP